MRAQHAAEREADDERAAPVFEFFVGPERVRQEAFGDGDEELVPRPYITRDIRLSRKGGPDEIDVLCAVRGVRPNVPARFVDNPFARMILGVVVGSLLRLPSSMEGKAAIVELELTIREVGGRGRIWRRVSTTGWAGMNNSGLDE